MAGEDRLERTRALVDARLNELLPDLSAEPSRLHEAMRYSALATGKRLRPAFAIAGAESLGGTAQIALDAGCAAELVHCFSLIHDDLPCIDDDDLRRGRPTCHKQFGEALAVLAGDALFAAAFDVASRCSPDPAKVARCVSALARATGSLGLVGGEVMDIESEGQSGDIELLTTIHARKTGALLGASCAMGGILAGANGEQERILDQFGREVGLAFQIADDLLNETSTAEQLGKAVGSDRSLGKLTYPGLLGLEASRTAAEEIVRSALQLLQNLPGDTSGLRELAEYSIERVW
ncbi:polyprenyl synthetase family protein [Kamptonema cortianum]|nr:polyprenyl synthetase family protein [Geitlerinema splendidum]MDK3157610.1 polyprenyl synthetase family protein [Kamptonema cortianum]